MINLLYVEINFIAITVLLLLLFNLHSKQSERIPSDEKLFAGLIVTNIFICLFDTGMWLINGTDFLFAENINLLVTFFYYLLNPFMCYLWILYTEYKLHESKAALSRRAKFLAVPLVIDTLLTICSLSTGWFFAIDADNQYSRGPLFLIMALSSAGYLLGSLLMTVNDMLRSFYRERRAFYLYLIALPVLMIAVTAIQTLYFGISIIWIFSALMLLSVYINMQNAENSTDRLTGLYNRRRLDTHLNLLCKQPRTNKILFTIMMDLNDFKQINDTLGHLVGDDALKQTATILTNICKDHDDFAARMGGDEFLIVGERQTLEEIVDLTEQINKQVEVFNKHLRRKYKLSISMGYSLFSAGLSPDALICAADEEMYRNKQLYKKSKKIEPDIPTPYPLYQNELQNLLKN